jgi:hypothetical protein
MKTFILTIVAFTLMGLVSSQSVIPNGDFENWTDQYHIQYWDGLNYDGGFINFHTFQRTDDAWSGNYAAQVETINNTLVGTLPGIGFTGTIDFDPSTFDYSFNFGIPVEGRPSSITGFFKYEPTGGDTMAIVVGMFRWNETQGDLDSIGGGFFYSVGATTSYTAFTAPIEYFVPGVEADTMYIIMFSSLDSYHPGSKLKVDELSLNYQTIGIEPDFDIEPVSVFPNPASGYFQVNGLSHRSFYQLILKDVSGRKVLEQAIENEDKIVLPSGIKNGIYFIEIQEEGMQLLNTKLMVVK